MTVLKVILLSLALAVTSTSATATSVVHADGGVVGDDGNDKQGDDPDIPTSDQVCLKYIKQFLNGSTDARDECEGLLNAYETGGCKSGDDKDGDGRFRRGLGDNTIDDFFENFECCDTIHTYYTSHCKEPELDSYKLLGIVSVLVLCGLVKSLIRTFRIRWLPEAAGCILVGGVVGGVLRLVTEFDMYFNDYLFLRILLPPIVFEAALTIDKVAFRRHAFPIAVFAVAGTILSAFVTGLIVHGLTTIESSVTTIPMVDSLLFGALISSIDPVVTLSVFSSVGISQTDILYVLVFGESLLNDAASIVLFDAMVGFLDSSVVVDKGAVWSAIGHFCYVSLGSLAIGLGFGVLSAVYYWSLRGKQIPVVEVALFFCWALIPYYICDGVGFSGILSIMAAGFFMDMFVIGYVPTDDVYGDGGSDRIRSDAEGLRVDAEGNTEDASGRAVALCTFPSRSDVRSIFSLNGHLAGPSKHHVKFVAEVLSSLMETAIFAYMGLFLFSVDHEADFTLSFTAIFASIVSRTFMIGALSLIINILAWLECGKKMCNILGLCCSSRSAEDAEDVRRKNDAATGEEQQRFVDRNMQIILIISGMRGAVSLALAESIPVYNAVTKDGSQFKPELKNMTLSCIIFTVFVFGASTYHMLKRLGLHGDRSRPSHEPLLAADDEDSSSARNLMIS